MGAAVASLDSVEAPVSKEDADALEEEEGGEDRAEAAEDAEGGAEGGGAVGR